MDVRVRVWEVVAKSGLVVGSGGYELEVWTPDAPATEILGDEASALELEGLWRHNELGVIAQQGDHSFEIASLKCVHEPIHGPCFIFRSCSRNMVRNSSQLLDLGARPLQGAVHRRGSGLEHLSDLGR